MAKTVAEVNVRTMLALRQRAEQAEKRIKELERQIKTDATMRKQIGELKAEVIALSEGIRIRDIEIANWNIGLDHPTGGTSPLTVEETHEVK